MKFESLKDDFESMTSRIDAAGITPGAIQKLNGILERLEGEAAAAPARYKMGMLEDVDDYRKQLRGYTAEAAGMGIT